MPSRSRLDVGDERPHGIAAEVDGGRAHAVTRTPRRLTPGGASSNGPDAGYFFFSVRM
jgi:hypothetical protein